MSSYKSEGAGQRVIVLDSGKPNAIKVLSPVLEKIFTDIVVETVDVSAVEETVSDADQFFDEPTIVVCTASMFQQRFIKETFLRIPSTQLVVVDFGAASNPPDIQTHPGVTYVHADSTTKQILATLSSSLLIPRQDGDTEAASQSGSFPISVPFPERLFREAPVPLLVADTETRTVVSANNRACELLGRSRESLLGTTQEKLHPESPNTDYHEGFQQSVDTGGGDSYRRYEDQLYIESGDGDRLPVDIVDTTVEFNGRTYMIGAFLDVSDRVEEQAALRRRSIAMDVSLTGISILDSDETYIYMNEAHANLFGYDPEELIGEGWWTLYDEATQTEIELGPFEELDRTGSWEGDLTGQTKDGDPIDHHISLTHLPDGGIVCVNPDITDKKRFERQLDLIREAAQSLMLATDRDAVIDKTIEVITETLNRPVVGYHRYDETAQELRPVSVSSSARELFGDPPTFTLDQALVWRAFKAGETQYYTDLEAVDGLHNPETPIRSELHVPVGDRGVFTVGSITVDDIPASDRKLLDILITHVQTALKLVDRRFELRQARDRAKAERKQLRQVIDSVPQFIFAKNDAGEFIFANEAVAEAYGTTPSKLEGKTDADFAPDDADVEVFTEDDRRVIETGEPVYRYGETLTDVHDNRRILETQKITFDPVDTEGPAVLGSSTDVTELERTQQTLAGLRRLKSIYKLESELRSRTRRTDIHQAGIDAILEGLNDVFAAAYSWDAADNILRQTAVSNGDTSFPETLTAEDETYWRAFATNQHSELDGVADSQALAVPIGSTGLLAVAGVADDAKGISEFIHSVADTLAVAIERSDNWDSAEELRRRLNKLTEELDATKTNLESVSTTIEGILGAQSKVEVDRLLVEFLGRNWAYGWVGAYRAQEEVVEPTATTDDDGPAVEFEVSQVDESSPSLEAIRTRSPVYVDQTVEKRETTWGQTAFAYGYQSVLAVPVVHQGVIYGVVVIASKEADGVDNQSEKVVRSVCALAGRRLKELSANSVGGRTLEHVEVDVRFTESRPFFPSLPADTSIQVQQLLTIDSSERRMRLTVNGFDPSEFDEYISKTPGLHSPAFDERESDTVFDAKVSLDVSRRDSTEAFFDAIAAERVRISRVSADSADELVTLTGDDQSGMSAVVELLTAQFKRMTLLAKRAGVDDSSGLRTPLETLTDRQREILLTAYREGYYDQPKGINGEGLADLYNISHSTVHEHLRAAESNLMKEIIGQDVSNPNAESKFYPS